MNKFFIFILSIFCTATSFAGANNSINQDSASRMGKNSLFLELGGNAFYYSLNYERIFFNKTNKTIGVRIGAGYEGLENIAVPTLINYYIGRIHLLELGIGITSVFNLDNTSRNIWKKYNEMGYQGSSIYIPIYQSLPIVNIEYKHQFINGFFYRAGLSSFLLINNKIYDTNKTVFLWGNICVGMNFKKRK